MPKVEVTGTYRMPDGVHTRLKAGGILPDGYELVVVDPGFKAEAAAPENKAEPAAPEKKAKRGRKPKDATE